MKYFFFSLLFCFVMPSLAAAQFVPNQPNVSISTSPLTPEPNELVQVNLNAYTIDTTGATIIWFVDGVENTAARNLRTFSLTSKGLGETTDISVRITQRTGQTINANTTIRPAQLDIVLEANTMTPGFYKGRPLLTVGSQARAVAIPDLGDTRRPEDFTYFWKLNNEPLYGGPVTGRNFAAFTLGLGRNQILTVDALDSNGTLVAKKSIGLPLVEPEIHFYPLNPLRGISPRVLESPVPLIGNEVTVRAEPYYMNRDILEQSPLLEWKINNQTVTSDPQNPLELTLRRNSDLSGTAEIEFHIRNMNQLVQGVRESFQISF